MAIFQNLCVRRLHRRADHPRRAPRTTTIKETAELPRDRGESRLYYFFTVILVSVELLLPSLRLCRRIRLSVAGSNPPRGSQSQRSPEKRRLLTGCHREPAGQERTRTVTPRKTLLSDLSYAPQA